MSFLPRSKLSKSSFIGRSRTAATGRSSPITRMRRRS
jgi:hypothetical protein